MPRTTLRVAAISLATFCLAPAPADAALSVAQSRCQRQQAWAAGRFLRTSIAALATCHARLGRGVLPAGTDCDTEAGTAHTLAVAALELESGIHRQCTDELVTSLGFGADCVRISTAAGLAGCLQQTHGAQARALIDALYGVPGAAAGELSTRGRRCQTQISRRARRFLVGRLRLLQRCKNGAARDRLPAGVRCEEEPDTASRIDALRVRAADGLTTFCDEEALAELDFAAPCTRPADATALAACVLEVAGAAADTAALAEYGDGGFCGDAHQGVEARVEALLSAMTLEEKVLQMHGSGLLPQDGVWPTPDNERLGIPGFRMLDGPRGASRISGNATTFPVGMARGATWDPDLEERVGAAIGEEVRAKGASVLLAPVTTVVRHPRWGRAQESYGEDPLHVGRMGVGFIRGAQQHVIASVKHYAVNSIEDTRFTVNVSVDERTLREIYLPHFRMAVRDGRAGSVMAAYNRVNGQYCAENAHLLRDILKGDWGFRGFVESDWVFGTYSTVPSALAGLDVEMPLARFYGQRLADAVAAGEVPVAIIDEAVRRILRTKLCFRLDTQPPVRDPSRVESPEHAALALEVAQKAIVLLKNTGAVLPLDQTALESIAVVGTLADVANLGDSGSSDVEPSRAVSPLAGIRDRAGTGAVSHVPGASLSAADRAVIAAAGAVVIVTGLTEQDEGESLVGAGDRETLGLAPDQEQLIEEVAALNQVSIVVLEGGSALTVEPWIDDVEAVLMAWYPGQEGGHAIADVLFGDVNPSGRLPLTFARSGDDLPEFLNDRDEVTYGYFHGYRHLDREGVEPRFAFGFGLSYTTYAYANLTVADTTLAPDDTLEVTVDVTNTGSVAGDEIVQLYVGTQGSSVPRAVRDLETFAKVHLVSGETKTVPLRVPVEDLAYYDVGSSAWRVEPLTYRVHVGSSSRDLPLSAAFDVRAPAE
jgi:beta-glucosidase